MEKKLILDYSKWRCGGNQVNQIGEGRTCLLNRQGFMCCLGQFSKQLNPKVTEKTINGWDEPADLGIHIVDLNYPEPDEFQPDIYLYPNTALSNKAIEINDDKFTTPEEKIKQLKELFLTAGYEIEVINQPQT